MTLLLLCGQKKRAFCYNNLDSNQITDSSSHINVRILHPISKYAFGVPSQMQPYKRGYTKSNRIKQYTIKMVTVLPSAFPSCHLLPST